MISLNFISGELENPFGHDANDLPLGRFQKEMNNCLLMLLHRNSDHAPTTSGRCEKDLDCLIRSKAKRFSSISFSTSVLRDTTTTCRDTASVFRELPWEASEKSLNL